MAGYIRQDVSNNIANGNVVDADDLDKEFDAIAGAFNTSTGHTHDGTSAEGAPITVIGPAQDVSVTSGAILPKTTNVYDLGSNSLKWKNLFLEGNLSVSGTVDGRDVATDGTKLDGIETGATSDQSAAEIKVAYESNANTNAYTDAEKTKLTGIETGATADQTSAEIKSAYESNDNTNAYTDAEKVKLAGVEALADVTDATNVTAAGALMDSELTDITAVKALDQGVATTDSPTFVDINGATGTFSGNFVVDTNTFFVDTVNNRVGIGTSSPSSKLDVTGDAEISGLTFGRGGGNAIENTAIGFIALLDNTTGSGNTATGSLALSSNTTAASNTATGYLSMFTSTTGSDNSAYGKSSLANNTTGDQNTAVGSFALASNTTGINNIGVGHGAGITGSPFTVTTQDNRIVMGNNSHTNAYIKVGWTVTSDKRDKTEFSSIPYGLSFVNALRPVEYQFKVGGREGQADGIRRFGFLAQDILELEGQNPVIVDREDPENLKLKEAQIVPVLVNAIKELSQQLEALKNEVLNLKGT